MDTELTFTEPVCSVSLSIITKSTRYYPTTIRKQVITRNSPISTNPAFSFVKLLLCLPEIISHENQSRIEISKILYFQNIEISKKVMRRHGESRTIMGVEGGGGLGPTLFWISPRITKFRVMMVKQKRLPGLIVWLFHRTNVSN